MHDNLDDEQKQQLKTEDNKIKKPKHDNWNVDNIQEKNERKLCIITSIMNEKNI